MENSFYLKDILTVDSLTRENILTLFKRADEMKSLEERREGNSLLQGKIMAALFYEPSSRTFASFISAMQRLGGGIIPLNGMSSTSVAKGETLADTSQVFASYADIIVIRHSEIGSAKLVAQNVNVPVINAGDGPGEHPTQALLDSYTIRTHFPSFSNLTVGLVGDLLYGRTTHSLSKLLLKLGVRKFVFISPAKLRMPREITQKLKEGNGEIYQTDNLAKAIGNLDVLYVTRIQKERFKDLDEYEKLKDVYVVTPQLLKKAKKKMVVMHPLPRLGEISTAVDNDERAIYLPEQVKNGLYIRMALLSLMLSPKK